MTKMYATSTEILRNYANMILEAENPEEGGPQPLDVDNEFDSDKLESNNKMPADVDQEQDELSTDPIIDLSAAIASSLESENASEQEIEQTIKLFLKKNNYELTPVNGLTNSFGKL